jgi:hypothetical protein
MYFHFFTHSEYHLRSKITLRIPVTRRVCASGRALDFHSVTYPSWLLCAVTRGHAVPLKDTASSNVMRSIFSKSNGENYITKDFIICILHLALLL